MPDNALQRQLVQKITITTLVGLVGWIGLLIQASSKIRESAVGSSYDVAIGPLVLNRLAKHPTDAGSYSVSFSFDPGLIWYFAGCILLGAAIGSATAVLRKNK